MTEKSISGNGTRYLKNVSGKICKRTYVHKEISRELEIIPPLSLSLRLLFDYRQPIVGRNDIFHLVSKLCQLYIIEETIYKKSKFLKRKLTWEVSKNGKAIHTEFRRINWPFTSARRSFHGFRSRIAPKHEPINRTECWNSFEILGKTVDESANNRSPRWANNLPDIHRVSFNNSNLKSVLL